MRLPDDSCHPIFSSNHPCGHHGQAVCSLSTLLPRPGCFAFTSCVLDAPSGGGVLVPHPHAVALRNIREESATTFERENRKTGSAQPQTRAASGRPRRTQAPNTRKRQPVEKSDEERGGNGECSPTLDRAPLLYASPTRHRPRVRRRVWMAGLPNLTKIERVHRPTPQHTRGTRGGQVGKERQPAETKTHANTHTHHACMPPPPRVPSRNLTSSPTGLATRGHQHVRYETKILIHTHTHTCKHRRMHPFVKDTCTNTRTTLLALRSRVRARHQRVAGRSGEEGREL